MVMVHLNDNAIEYMKRLNFTDVVLSVDEFTS